MDDPGGDSVGWGVRMHTDEMGDVLLVGFLVQPDSRVLIARAVPADAADGGGVS